MFSHTARIASKLASKTRPFSTQTLQPNAARFGLAAGLTGIGAFTLSQQKVHASSEVDYDAVRNAIADILELEHYDDGSFGPIFIRLAWHASGTYDIKNGSGGSNGATMRFRPESDHAANAGLHIARNTLEKVKKKFPGITYADLWTLAGAVAVKEMGGPEVPWSPGRSDAAGREACPPDGRLPDASQGAEHLREIFWRMGMNDQEIVALNGAHTFGRCHIDRSGYLGPWTRAPTTFSNLFYEELFNNEWTKKSWGGPEQFEDPTHELMMLPTDISIKTDPIFREYALAYKNDEELFAKDFSAAFGKLMALGVPPQGTNWMPAMLIGGIGGIGGLIALATTRGQ